MSDGFKQILISNNQPDFAQALTGLRTAIITAAALEPDDPAYRQLIKICSDVAKCGDKALTEYTQKYDGVSLSPEQFRIALRDSQQAHTDLEKTDPELLGSVRQAIANVKKYQTEIFGARTIGGKVIYTPLERVGLCIPGASAPLPSTVIMTAVPAQVAGVKQIAVVCPPRYNGSIHPLILAVCFELGITEVYRIGGAQAVAALAAGTETIPKVDKIVGPGNRWVQSAKKYFFGRVDIDSVAGPSEVLILADKEANPAWVAADMLSQAEHAPASAVLFTDSSKLAQQVLAELAKQTAQLDRAEQTADCLRKYSGIVVFEDLDKAVAAANDFASEHLQIQCGQDSSDIAEKIRNAGAIFIGPYCPVAAGDYFAGPSHTLPTGTSARFFSPLSSNDFVKSTSIIEYSKEQLAADAGHIMRLALAEGLDAHAKSVRIRISE